MARNEDSGSNSTVQQSHIPVCYGSAFGRNGCTGINRLPVLCMSSQFSFSVHSFYIKKTHKKLVLIAYYLEITQSTAI